MLKEIALRELAPSPTNPRKHFDQAKLEELSRSVAEKGVLEPLLVRPRRPSPPWTTNAEAKYEVVAGERRFRAATMAGVETVPCIVRELDDVEALEVQTIENLQRDDLHPLEEAQGYAALMKEAGYDVAGIAQRVSKSDKYVYDRLKLLQLVPALQKVFLEGEITVGHAILLARLSSTDQERALKGGGYGFGSGVNGLFQLDMGAAAEIGLELGDRRRRKAVSVKELQKWIDTEVRFRPEEVDLPNLFPETAVALQAAAEEELKVVKITREYRVPDGAKDPKERTIGRQSWKRADGEPDRDPWDRKARPSKECEHSVMGIIVAGPGRGEAFRVCAAKKKCSVHWAKEQKEAEDRKKAGAKGAAARDDHAARQQRWQEEDRKRKEERERWKKARPQLLEALAEAIKAAPSADLMAIVLDKVKPYGAPKKSKEMGGEPTTLEDAVQLAAFFVLSESVTSEWRAAEDAPKALKRVGIDAKAIVDEVAPKPKPEKKAKKKSEKKPGARARRRAKKGAEA